MGRLLGCGGMLQPVHRLQSLSVSCSSRPCTYSSNAASCSRYTSGLAFGSDFRLRSSLSASTSYPSQRGFCHLQLRQGQQSFSTQAAPTGSTPATERQQPQRANYSPLHYNVEEFCQRIVPSEDEKKTKQLVVEGIRQCTRKAFADSRQIEVQVFGSFANGLSTWHSDVDLVVTGLMEPDRVTGVYDVADRGKVTARLRRIADQLRKHKKLEIRKLAIIARARMPIIKLRTKSNVSVDVSISDETGLRAANFMVQQARAFPPMKPLTLLLKTYLKAVGLNDVATGGLSSYSLSNMVLAHLQEELKAGRDIFDLGETLYGFFLRYGEEFDYEIDAVSVASGGIVLKSRLGFAMDSARFAASTQAYHDGAVSWRERLCVDCPLSGRDVSNGTYRMDSVRQAFYKAARSLEALAKGRKVSDTSINYLGALFDVQRVLKRTAHVSYEDSYIKVIDDTARTPERFAQGGPPGGPSSFDAEEDEEFEIEDDADDDDVMTQEPTAGSRSSRAKGGGGGKAR